MNLWISLLSLVVCVLVAGVLAQTRPFASLAQRQARFETLDGLRGFLALAVFFHHFMVTYYWKLHGRWTPPPEHGYLNYGNVGVAMFFMLTGFLFVSKILQAEGRLDWCKLFESRIFRIFPLYLFALLAITLIVFHSTGYQLKSSPSELWKQYLQWFTFHGGTINGFWNTRKIIASVDWTLKYEWAFYLALPLLSFLLCRGGRFAALALLAASVALGLWPVTFLSLGSEFSVLFAVGGVAAHLARSPKLPVHLVRSRPASVVAALLLAAALLHPASLSWSHILVIGLFFILVALGNDLFGLFRSSATILMGEVSYSIYLLHGLVLYLLFTQFPILDLARLPLAQYAILMPITSLLVLAVSTVTFLCIERPLMNLGRRYPLTGFLRSLLGRAGAVIRPSR